MFDSQLRKITPTTLILKSLKFIFYLNFSFEFGVNVQKGKKRVCRLVFRPCPLHIPDQSHNSTAGYTRTFIQIHQQANDSQCKTSVSKSTSLELVCQGCLICEGGGGASTLQQELIGPQHHQHHADALHRLRLLRAAHDHHIPARLLRGRNSL